MRTFAMNVLGLEHPACMLRGPTCGIFLHDLIQECVRLLQLLLGCVFGELIPHTSYLGFKFFLFHRLDTLLKEFHEFGPNPT